ncbi:MAG TPA: beta-galactosidase [Firmicutes bacterium]|jgi:beta-galactosidase|nr:beta-galactosidase [Bacillota bacterium]
MISSKLPKILYGGDYNPEQWPENLWLEDMKLMKQAGVNLVSIGIFSWALLQPNEETYNFEWLDRLLNLLAENHIYADLATATAAQPAWLSQYSDVLPVDVKVNKISYGSRQSYCPNSPTYRRLGQQLVRSLAERYKNHSALAMWHINNEYACHIQSCYCENCAQAFRSWLQKKYETVEKVNEAWGTNFWSQHYYDWSEIIPPRATSTFPNPSQVLDYRRFMSDSLLDCYLGEYGILKSITPDIPVTTNFMGDFKPLNYFEWAKHIDVVSWDSYPNPEPNYHPSWAAFNHDLMRGLKKGQPFILMEQATNNVNWRPTNTNKRPGVMPLWSYQAMAHGADGIMFFQWRQSLKGAEKFHSAMITHTGDDQSRVYREVSKLGAELGSLNEIIDSRVPSEVAILFDYENWWAVEYDQRPSENLKYLEQIRNFYNPLFALNIPVDILPVDADLTRYKLVIAPLLYMVKPGVKENLENYVANGGTFITTFFSGIVDETDGVFPGGYPGPLAALLGISIEEFDALEPHLENNIELIEKIEEAESQYRCELWCDVVKLHGAKGLANFTQDYYAGYPALTENHFGKGKAYYLATQPDQSFFKKFIKHLCQLNQIKTPLEAPAGVEVLARNQCEQAFLFVLNHNQYPVSVALPVSLQYQNLISKKTITGQLTLEAKEAAILCNS